MNVSKPQAMPGMTCPLYKKDISKVCHNCAWFTHMRGNNPQSGQETDEWMCAISWLPILSVEVAKNENQTGAAVESFRNRMVEQNERIINIEKAKSMGQPYEPLIIGTSEDSN